MGYFFPCDYSLLRKKGQDSVTVARLNYKGVYRLPRLGLSPTDVQNSPEEKNSWVSLISKSHACIPVYIRGRTPAAVIAVSMALLTAEVIAVSPLCSQNVFMIWRVTIMQTLDLCYLLFIFLLVAIIIIKR